MYIIIKSSAGIHCDVLDVDNQQVLQAVPMAKINHYKNIYTMVPNVPGIKGLQKMRTSPSVIAEAFEYDCDRHFIYSSLNRGIQEHFGIVQNDKQTHLSQAGDELEYQILEDHNLPPGVKSYGVKKNYHPELSVGQTKGVPVDFKSTIDLLKNPPTQYLYQLTLLPTEQFKKDYNFHSDFEFKDSHPDLVKIERDRNGNAIFKIIDIKLARKVKLKQKIQVTLYALLLKYILDDNNITNASVDLECGYIWNNGNNTPTEFDMKEVIPFVEDFLRNKIPSLCDSVSKAFQNVVHDNTINLEAIIDILHHKMSYNCEWCSSYKYCNQRGCSKQDIKSIPYLSKYAQSHLDDIHSKHNPGTLDITVSNMSQYIHSKVKEDLEQCRTLKDFFNPFDTTSLIIDKHLDILAKRQSFDYKKIDELIQSYNKTDIDQWVQKLSNIKNAELAVLQSRLLNYKGSGESFPYTVMYLQGKIDEIDQILQIVPKILNSTKQQSALAELNNLKQYNLAIQTFYILNRVTMQIPKMEDVRIFLTAQADEATGRMFALGLACEASSVTKTKVNLPTNLNKYTNFSYVAVDKNDFNQQEEKFVQQLYDIFIMLDNYNQSQEWANRISVQTYVMDNYEWSNVEKVLYSMVQQGRMVSEVLTILFWLQSSQLVTVDETPKEILCQFPVVALTPVARQLFILPADISYGMDDLANIFEVKQPYKKFIPQYANILTNVLPSEVINSSWKHRTLGNIQEADREYQNVKNNIELRLSHGFNILNGMRQELKIEEAISSKAILVSWAKKFVLPQPNTYSLPILSQLDFQTRYETLLSRLQTRAPRIGLLEEAIDKNEILHVKYLRADSDGEMFEILNPNPASIKDLPFSSMICSISSSAVNDMRCYEDTTNFVPVKYEYLDSINYNTCHFRAQNIGAQNTKYYLILVPNTNKRGIAYPLSKKVALNPYQEYYIFEYHMDWLTHYIIGGAPTSKMKSVDGILKQIDQNVFATNMKQFLTDPIRHAKLLSTGAMSQTYLEEYEKRFLNPFTPSQREAFNQFYEQNLSLILGPPGTGKTNFIAMSLLILIINNNDNNKKPMRILVSGMSHASIDNVLYKVEKFYQNLKGNVPRVAIGKVDKLISENSNIDIVEKKNVGGYFAKNSPKHIILGSTLWAMGKAYANNEDLNNQNDLFDVIVIDEASQVRIMDSLLAISHVSPEGRVLIVGDDEQLSPIIQGVYEQDENDPINRYGSIFGILHDYDTEYKKISNQGYKYTKQLNEQFRMNDILSLYSAKEIYGKGYRAGNQATSEQKLQIGKSQIKLEGFYDCVMDPEYPFVVCNITEGTNQDKRDVEVSLVAGIAKWCSEYLLDNKGQPYQSSADFWKDGMFIISPHHEQINLIKSKLQAEMGLLGQVAFVDTVDKMQGQEAEVAVVSYGVTDLEQAMLEKEFIFSRNRLNVSITRGKKKMILFLSDVLSEKQMDVLGETDDEIIKGIKFMTSIKEFARTPGTENGFTTTCVNSEWNLNNISIDVLKKKI